MKKSILIIPFVFLLGSCAFHSGVMTSNPNFTSPNHELTALAVGTASTEKIFGIGGLKKDALVLEAKKNLYAVYPLKKGQSYANTSVDLKKAFYLFFSKTTVTISADIVQIDNAENLSEEYQPIFSQIREDETVSLRDISLGDTVKNYFAGTSHDYVVNKILANDMYLLRSVTGEITKMKEVDRMKIFILKDITRNSVQLKINQEVLVPNSFGKPMNAKIEALGINEAIVEVIQKENVLHLKRRYSDIKMTIDNQ